MKSPIPSELTVVCASENSFVATIVAVASLMINLSSGAIGVSVASV